MTTDYYSDRRLSNSKLTCLAQDPRKFKALYVDNPPTWKQPDNDAFVFGHAVHCLALEPNEFGNRFAVAPKVDRRTAQGKNDWAQFVSDSEGKELLDDQTYEDALDCVQALNNHAEYAAIMEQPKEVEVPISFEFLGHDFKCKPDAVIHSMRTILDVKTIRDASPSAWEWEAPEHGYHRQAVLYQKALEAETGHHYRFVFAIVEKPTPSTRGLEPTVALYEMNSQAMDAGIESLRSLVYEYEQRLENDDWKRSYSKGIVSCGVRLKKVYSEV